MDAGSAADEIARAASMHVLSTSLKQAAPTVAPVPAAAISKTPKVAPAAAARIGIQGPPQAVLRGSDAIFTVTLTAAPGEGKTIKVHYETVNGGARAGVHYAKTVGDLVFTGSETAKTVLVPTIPDSPDRYPKLDDFSLQLSSPTRGTKITNAAAIARLAASFAAITIDNPTVAEGNSGSSVARFVVSLNAPNSKPVTVDYTTGDGAATTADNDYTAVSGTLTFAPGETRKTIDVPVAGDASQESDETFRIRLSNPSSNAFLQQASGVATIVNDDGTTTPTGGGGFQIKLEFATSVWGPVPKAVRDACEYAATRWSQVLVGDLPDVNDPDLGTIDDFYMTVSMGLLGMTRSGDGPSGTLANAVAIGVRSDASKLPYLGIAGVDPADANRPELKGILLHEIGHALGFASGVSVFDKYVRGSGFTGPSALREYRSIFGTNATSVPLETDGGQGTAGSHWDEQTFKTELMTGYVDRQMQLSRITVAAMEDMGYKVNYAAADPYSKPAGLTAAPPTATRGAAASLGPASLGSVVPVAVFGSLSRAVATTADAIQTAADHAAHRSDPIGALPDAAPRPKSTTAIKRTTPVSAAATPRPLPRQFVFATLGNG